MIDTIKLYLDLKYSSSTNKLKGHEVKKGKIYRFRQLKSCEDLCRIKQIIETGKFWCSKFSDLNDPMEGVYIASDYNSVNENLNQKNKYKICSFSGERGFENPIMWGYYAGGFHGVAIEVEVDINEIKQVKYTCDTITSDNVKDILTSKLFYWEHEDEYRYLDNSNSDNLIKIGKITKVYFGNPYGGLTNTDNIKQDNKNLIKYEEFREELVKLMNQKGIQYSYVEVKGNQVVSKETDLSLKCIKNC